MTTSLWMKLLLGFVGAILLIFMLMWVEQQLGLQTTVVQDILVEPLKNFANDVMAGLGSPFVGLQTFFESILPDAMRPYAPILAMTLIVSMVLLTIIIVWKLVRRL